MIIGSYWPCKSDHNVDNNSSETTGTLWQRVTHWQNSFKPKRPGSPLEYVQSVIMKKTYQHVSPLGNSALLLGDLNGSWGTSRANHKLKEWGEKNGWFNRIYTAATTSSLPIYTFYRG